MRERGGKDRAAVSRHRYELEKGAQVPRRLPGRGRADGASAVCQISNMLYSKSGAAAAARSRSSILPSSAISGLILSFCLSFRLWIVSQMQETFLPPLLLLLLLLLPRVSKCRYRVFRYARPVVRRQEKKRPERSFFKELPSKVPYEQ